MSHTADSLTPHQLVAVYVRETADLPAKEAARRIGVAPGTIRKWRSTLPHYPNGRVRRRVEEYLSWMHEQSGRFP